MKHKSKFHNIPLSFPSACGVEFKDAMEKHHELSYYLDGGIDLTGKAVALDGDAEFDSEAEADDIIAEGASSVALGDPKTSRFDLVEIYGSSNADSLTADNPKPNATPTGEGEK